MTSVYNDYDLLNVYKQRRKIFNVFLAVTGVYVAICLVCLLFYMSLPYNDPMQTPISMVVYLATPPYVVFLFPYMGIKYRRVNRYYRVLVQLSIGRKNIETHYFYRFIKNRSQKDNVDVHFSVFGVWDTKNKEWRERESYLDAEKPLPDFQEGDNVRYVTQANFIIQYDVLERGVVEFEEVDEE